MKPPAMAPMYVLCFARVTEVARGLGYALAVHGTMVRDLDMIAAPWTDEAVPAEELAAAVAEAVAWTSDKAPLIDGPIRKPHGRLAWRIPFRGEAAIDLSVMPLARSTGGES